jgi:hypothetical protein
MQQQDLLIKRHVVDKKPSSLIWLETFIRPWSKHKSSCVINENQHEYEEMNATLRDSHDKVDARTQCFKRS